MHLILPKFSTKTYLMYKKKILQKTINRLHKCKIKKDCLTQAKHSAICFYSTWCSTDYWCFWQIFNLLNIKHKNTIKKNTRIHAFYGCKNEMIEIIN